MSGGQVHIDPETVFTRFLRGKVVTTRSSGEPFPCFSEEGHLTIDDLYGRFSDRIRRWGSPRYTAR